MRNRTQLDATALGNRLGHWQSGRGSLKVRLKNAITRLVVNGELVSGDRLPPERRLATALAVSRNTVVGAYDLLREDGLPVTRRASGSTVSSREAGKSVHEHRARAIGKTYDLEAQTGTIDFAVADMPLAAAFERYIRDYPALLHRDAYSAYGLEELRAALAVYYTNRGLPTSKDEILITNGGQQGISLAAGLYLQRGDGVAVQNPTFFVALDALRMAGARLYALTENAAEQALRESIIHAGARLAYIVPTNHNPTGTTMPIAQRKAFAKITDDLGVPLLEDLVLEELTYDGTPLAPIASFARAGTVLCVGSLSKVFWSGLRVGWVRAPAPIIAQLARIKTVTDLGNNIISQSIALGVMRDFGAVCAYRRRELAEKLHTATQLIDEYLPDWTYTRPEGGFCLWLRIPAGDARSFVHAARRFGVNIIAGSAMTIDESATDRLRLVFCGPMQPLEEGIRRLARAWETFTARGFAAPVQPKGLVV